MSNLAVIVQITAAVKAQLDAAAALVPAVFTRAFESEITYVPNLDFRMLTGTKVKICPRSSSSEIETRGADKNEYEIDLAVVAKISASAAAAATEIPELLLLSEELVKVFRRRTLTLLPAFSCSAAVNDPIYDGEILRRQNQFIGIITLTFRGLVHV